MNGTAADPRGQALRRIETASAETGCDLARRDARARSRMLRSR